MCGLLGWIGPPGARAEERRTSFERALARLDHRGPDGRGVRAEGAALLGHTRLAVRDPGAPGAAQPMVSPCGRWVLVYNGELYDDAALRAALEPEVQAATGGAGFETRCDAETLLWLLSLRGIGALDRLRGMYALALLDVRDGVLWLARDPLGIKPLVHTVTSEGAFAFASEPAALLELDGVTAAPDLEMVSAYLATSRRSLFGRTLFSGVHSVRPGEVIRVDLEAPWRGGRVVADAGRFAAQVEHAEDARDRARALVQDSVRAHLVADRPLCALLSGGLDSAIVTQLAAASRGAEGLATWCAAGHEDGADIGPDPAAARLVAARVGTSHEAVPVDRGTFVRQWREHVTHLAQPLSTPNEVAISEISRAIRASGAVVALTGEGADELFGGYDGVLTAFDAHEAARVAVGDGHELSSARFHLEATSWVGPAAQEDVLRPELAGASSFLIRAMEREFETQRLAAGPRATRLEAHLRLQRVSNLTALLERLDGATMRHGVEGRTPFADLRVAAFADRLPMEQKFSLDGPPEARGSKLVLRRAFADEVPPEVLSRPKASFPLPFDRWSAPVTARLMSSEFLREVVSREALADVVRRPAERWQLAWLLGNLALFGEVAFGARAASMD